MICVKCNANPIRAKGIKIVKCFSCGIETAVNVEYHNLCKDCSDRYSECQSCGENFSKQYDASWVVHVNIQGE